jgi:murein DD-endopeptidase MepM/ murein hydrolase activator NlpD
MNPRILEPLLTALLVLALTINCPSRLSSQVDPAFEWHLLYHKIRDRLISKDEARAKLKELETMLKDFCLKNSDDKKDDHLVFPLAGYTPNAIGGKGGSGYQTQGYDFFDGNDHRGHPGHDIFIRDRNQDGLDDVTGKPVEVISASSGIVVSVNLNWEPSSPIRGGNCIWIYESIKSRYFYYAHLGKIFVVVGQVVSKGDRLGTVGRTGVNAYPTRSPTHLHFTVLQSMDGYPKPINLYSHILRNNLQ